jgi:imidazolonepropionase-like amidohydrolase
LEVTNSTSAIVIFHNVKTIYGERDMKMTELMNANNGQLGVVVVDGGKVVCYGTDSSCLHYASKHKAKMVNLEGGSLAPGLITVGSELGLEHIRGEASTQDGYVSLQSLSLCRADR